jgi:hypothetical protein
MLTIEAERGVGTKQFTLDGEHVDLIDFLLQNFDGLSDDEVRRIRDLSVGGEVQLGGGAAATFVLKRVA